WAAPGLVLATLVRPLLLLLLLPMALRALPHPRLPTLLRLPLMALRAVINLAIIMTVTRMSLMMTRRMMRTRMRTRKKVLVTAARRALETSSLSPNPSSRLPNPTSTLAAAALAALAAF
ncbi:hypothetical protein IL306_004943, partial [Fusarium sp. DS 682]